jgi:ABC-2 type transport system ATP-binding protein
VTDGHYGSPAFAIEHLTKRFGTLAAVNDLCLEVGRGRLIGLLGPNGAGKSTTIGCLSGLLEPTAGTITLLGEQLTGDSFELKRHIGVMPEGLALFDHLTAEEFLTFNARMYGLSRGTVRRRVDELIGVLDLANALTRPLVEYSTGMRKKVAFAAAIIHGPELLFLDEPFAGIDPSSAAMFKTWLRQFAAQGRTVFLTTHALETVERLCDEVAIIKEGSLAWRGEMRQVAAGGAVECGGNGFDSLEALYLTLVGEHRARLDWL